MLPESDMRRYRENVETTGIANFRTLQVRKWPYLSFSSLSRAICPAQASDRERMNYTCDNQFDFRHV